MAAKESLMPIGRFARACRLGIKALRHYDEEGLLRPAFVDRATGYRYYARDLMPYTVALRVEPPVLVAMRSIETTPEALIPATTAVLYALLAEVSASGRPVRAPVMCLNEEPDADERLMVHACAGLDALEPALPEARVETLPGGTFAWLMHRGSYE